MMCPLPLDEHGRVRSPHPLPAALVGRTFELDTARRLGVSDNRLRASDLTVPSKGIRTPSGEPPSLIEYAAAVLARTGEGWISHTTAAMIHGLWIPARLTHDELVHISRYDLLVGPRRQGVDGHQVRVHCSDLVRIDGLQVSSPARTWFELLPRLRRDEAVIIGDQLLRHPLPGIDRHTAPWSTPSELSDLVERNARRPGVRLGREVLPLLRQGSDSPSETQLRLAIVGAGLPEPTPQLRLVQDDPLSPTADLGYREQRIALQHEGGHHRGPDQFSRDIRRDERWLAAGFRVIRSDVSDTRTGFARVLAILRPLIGSAGHAA